MSAPARPRDRALGPLLALLLVLQVGWRAAAPPPEARVAPLPAAPPPALARLAALGDPVLAAKSVVLWLQNFDRQPGASIPFAALDYEALGSWLDLALALDPRAELPLLAASRIYAEVPDPARSRLMLDLVHRAFLEDPARRWRWLAHAVYVAQHRLHDPALALRYARALAAADAPAIPGWARQLEIFVLERMGRLDAARALLAELLASAALDPAEEAFLRARLADLEARAAAGGEVVENPSGLSR